MVRTYKRKTAQQSWEEESMKLAIEEFLKNENFAASSETFKTECASFGCQIPDISGKVVLHAGRRTHSVGNQTEPPSDITNKIKNETFTLESSFQECFSSKENQTSTPCVLHKSHKKEEPNMILNSTMDLDFISLKSRFNELQEEHKKLIAVTAELTNALQLNIMGQARNMHHVLDQCRTIYPSLFISENNYPQSSSGGINIGKNVFNSARNEEYAPSINHSENLLEHQKTPSEENFETSLNNEPNENLLNLDIGQIENEEPQLYTPVSEKEIKDILEIILNKAVQYLSEGEKNGEIDCCEIGKACIACQKEITKVVEAILVKVMESPRYKTSARCSTSTMNCDTTNLKPNQYPLPISNKLPQKLENDLTTVNINHTGTMNDSKMQKEEPEKNLSNTNVHFILTDDMIKNDLLNLDNEKILLILQELRWRLTKSKVEERNSILDAYIEHDILNLHEKQLWPELVLQRNCADVNEYLMRCLNTIASFRKGRDYLGSNDKVLKSVLLPQFKNDHGSTTSVERNMLIATLQKLSLQKHMRIHMIQEGLLDHLINFLDKSYNKLTLYSLEHGTALLMNLCFVDDAKKYCVNNAEKIINLLKKFITEQHTVLLPYVNGTLLSLLVHDDIRFEAKKQKLDQVVQQLVKNIEDEYLRQQLNFIIHSRFSAQLHSFIGDEDEHSQNPDVLESELDTDSELNLDEAMKVDYNKSGNYGMLKSQLDSVKKHNMSKFRIENSSRDGSLTGVRQFESNDQRKIKTSLSFADSNKRKKVLRRFQNFPNSTFCYLEICHRAQDETGTRTCGCTRCVPGKNRYSCGCYDVICSEIAEDIDNAICTGQSINRTKYIKKTFREGSVEIIENTKKSNGSCAICGDKICDCAFESRPKIHRTPPKT